MESEGLRERSRGREGDRGVPLIPVCSSDFPMKAPALDAVELPPEASALQRHFDARNQLSLRWFLGILTVASLLAIGMLAVGGFPHPLHLAFYAFNLLA